MGDAGDARRSRARPAERDAALRKTAAPTTIALRRAGVDEAAAVTDVYLASRRAAVPYVPRLVHTADDVRDWLTRIVLVEQEVWVAETAGRLVGMMVLRGDSLDHLYVVPEHQRRGVGTALLAHAKRQRRVLRLHTFQSNEPARDFYEKHGFKAVAFGDGGANEEGEPDVLYEWKGVLR